MTAMPRRTFLRAAAGLPLLPLVGCTRFLRETNVPGAVPEVPMAPTLGDGVNAFGFDLYAKLAANSANQFLSPYSISTALAMTAAGAKHATFRQMASVLHLPTDAAASDGIYRALTAAVSGGMGKPYTLAVANAIFAQTGYPWSDSFKTRIITNYHAAVQDADFLANPDKERVAINTWVEKQTNDKIKELLKPGIVTGETRMVLTNAIYFKGDWATAFEKDRSKDLPFTNMDGTKKDVMMMHKTGGDLYENADVQMLRLPYKGNDLSFLAVLPRKAEGFAKVEKSLSKESLAAWSQGLKPVEKLAVWLPRFKLETTYSLKEPLVALGMVDAFDYTNADFGWMLAGKAERILAISAVEHKAFVEVNEEGTEAAAATGSVIGLKSIAVDEKEFMADRPFVFAIRHEASGTILFLGRVAKL